MLDVLVALVTGAAFALGYVLARGVDRALEKDPSRWKNPGGCAIMEEHDSEH